MNPRALANVWVFVLVGVALVVIVVSFFRGSDDDPEKRLDFSQVLAAGREGRLESLEIRGEKLEVRVRNDEQEYWSRVARSTDVAKLLQDEDVAIGGNEPDAVRIRYRATGPGWATLFVNFYRSSSLGASS